MMRPDRSLMFWRQLAAMRAEPFAAVPDAELLSRYTARRDEAAFEELARRHGGMVWAVCRQLLPDPADAEDAFQAVFLAFVKSSDRVRNGNVGAWLHGTAVRGAMKIRRGAVRARQRDRATAKPEAATPPGDWNELLAAVHDEVGRLPEALRTAFVVCDLEGVSQPDAAARLGWKAGTLTGRLSKARKRLLDALTKRGLAPAATLGLLGLSAATTSADVPLKLLVTVLNFPSAAPGTIPAALAALSLEIVPMTLSKVKLLAVAAMLTCGLAAGTGTVLVQVADAQGPPGAVPAGAPPTSDPLVLLQQHAQTAKSKPPAVAEVEYKYLPLAPGAGLPMFESVTDNINEQLREGWEFAGTFTAILTNDDLDRVMRAMRSPPVAYRQEPSVTLMVFKKSRKPAAVAVGGGEGGSAAGGSEPPGGYPGASSAPAAPSGSPGMGGLGGLTNVPLAAPRVAAVPQVVPAFNADVDVLICTNSFVTTWNNNGNMEAIQYAVGEVIKPADVPLVIKMGVANTIVVKRALLVKSLGQATPPTAKPSTVPTTFSEVPAPKPVVESEPVVIELKSVEAKDIMELCTRLLPKPAEVIFVTDKKFVVLNAKPADVAKLKKVLDKIDVQSGTAESYDRLPPEEIPATRVPRIAPQAVPRVKPPVDPNMTPERIHGGTT